MVLMVFRSSGAVRQADGDPLAPLFASKMAGTPMDNFLGRPIAGGWIDHLSPKGWPLVDYIPASSLYHLFLVAQKRNAASGFEATPRLNEFHHRTKDLVEKLDWDRTPKSSSPALS
jgi:hypothetical protein